MKFRTEISIDKQFDLEPDAKILTLGSCFADRMGSHLEGYGLDILVNPFGVLYNPFSIANVIVKAISPTVSNKWIQNQERWVNLNYHSCVHGKTKESAETLEMETLNQVQSHLKESKLLIITFGTAYAYEWKETGEVVANCHKLPADNFIRRCLEVDEIAQKWRSLLQKLRSFNSKLKVVFTTSPVRHVRDSLVQNQFSKSTLNVALHKLSKEENVFYFPSYEIMMDDLRDYRFYKEDLLQPNNQALTYIQEKFSEFCYSSNMKSYCLESAKLKRRLQHKIMNSGEQSQKFLKETEKQLEQFTERYPFSKITKR